MAAPRSMCSRGTWGRECVVADFGVGGPAAGSPRPSAAPHRRRHGQYRARTRHDARPGATRAVEAGAALVESERARGLDLIGTGEMGIGNTTAAERGGGRAHRAPPEEVTGRGTGVDDATWRRKVAMVERGAGREPARCGRWPRRARQGRRVRDRGLAGVVLARRRAPDPRASSTASSRGRPPSPPCASTPDARHYLIAAHRSVEPGHAPRARGARARRRTSISACGWARGRERRWASASPAPPRPSWPRWRRSSPREYPRRASPAHDETPRPRHARRRHRSCPGTGRAGAGPRARGHRRNRSDASRCPRPRAASCRSFPASPRCCSPSGPRSVWSASPTSATFRPRRAPSRSVGGMVAPSLETLVALQPDLVVVTSSGNSDETPGAARAAPAPRVPGRSARASPTCSAPSSASATLTGRARAGAEVVAGLERRVRAVAERVARPAAAPRALRGLARAPHRAGARRGGHRADRAGRRRFGDRRRRPKAIRATAWRRRWRARPR